MPQEPRAIEKFIRAIPRIVELSPRAHVLLIAYHLYHSGTENFSATTLKHSFLKARLSPPSNFDVLLQELSSCANAPLLKKKDRYSLSIPGDEELKQYLNKNPQIDRGLELLNDLLKNVQNKNQELFLKEAITCAELKANRASIIMTWLLVLDHLEEYILKNSGRLNDFNGKLDSLSKGKKKITIKDDFLDIQESTLINVMRDAGIINKNVWKILGAKLDIRNTCAHPSDVVVPQSKVVDFIEDLVLNVVSKYK